MRAASRVAKPPSAAVERPPFGSVAPFLRVKSVASVTSDILWLDLVMFEPNALPPPGQISFTNAPLRDIVVLAYRLDQSVARYTLVGLAERVLKARVDIVAKPPEGAPPSQTLPMLRRLLTDRFHLRTHTETRQVPAYILTIARDGKLGPQLRPSSHDCTSPSMPPHAGERARLGPKGPD